MTKSFCQAIISATSRKEAERISDALVRKKLIAGTLITKGPSRYRWKGKIVQKTYYNILAFSTSRNKNKIISEVKKHHRDECPIIAFLEIDGNKEFLEWIKDSTQ